MEKLLKKAEMRNVICLVTACVISFLFMYFGYQNVNAGMKASYDVVALGDSILGKARGEENISYRFEEASGLTMYNGAFGGNAASRGEHADRYSYQEESLTLYRMAEAICRKDFGGQWADLSASQVKVWYFEEVMQGLSEIDFEQVDMLLLEFGVNDYASGRKLDNPENQYDVSTYAGALRYSIELFQKTYPNLKLVLVTPAYCHISIIYKCMEADFGGGTLDKYAAMEKEVAKQYGLDVIDVFYELGFNESNILDYTEDFTHLNADGRIIYGKFLGEKARELMEKYKKG